MQHLAHYYLPKVIMCSQSVDLMDKIHQRSADSCLAAGHSGFSCSAAT